jgi:heme-degrading monooxygenase HmoA
VTIAITSIRLRSMWNFFKFTYLVSQIINQIKSQKGFTKIQTSKAIGYTHYTLSVWESETDLQAFARSGAHLNAMKETSKISTEVSTYVYEAITIPNLENAKKILAEKGRVLTY